MAKLKLKKGDDIVVITGSSKNQTGKIDRIDYETSRVLVSGINLAKKHQKPNMLHPDGGIVEKPMSLHVSNVAFVDPKTKKPTRIGYKIVDGVKSRFAKKSQVTIA